MNETPTDAERIPRPPKGCLTWLVGAAILYLLWSLFFPEMSWTGASPLTIDVRLKDAAVHRPIVNATVTLLPDPPDQADGRIFSSNVLTSQSDARGRAILKCLFGAGGGNYNTTIVVRSSLVRCEAPGYVPREVRVSESDKIRFRDFPFFRRDHRTTLDIALSRE